MTKMSKAAPAQDSQSAAAEKAFHDELSRKHEQERLALQMHQQREMEALLESSIERDTFQIGQRVFLEIDSVLVPGTVHSGPHFDSSLNVTTDSGELHLYCEIHRVHHATRQRGISLASSNGLSNSVSLSRCSSFNDTVTRSLQNSEIADLGRCSSFNDTITRPRRNSTCEIADLESPLTSAGFGGMSVGHSGIHYGLEHTVLLGTDY